MYASAEFMCRVKLNILLKILNLQLYTDEIHCRKENRGRPKWEHCKRE